MPSILIAENPEASKVLTDWGLLLETQTISFDARVVASEKIVFGKGKEVTVGPQADWSKDACNGEVLSAVS